MFDYNRSIEQRLSTNVWQFVAKDNKNAGKSTKEILEMVADAL
jgi:hypothetical protein